MPEDITIESARGKIVIGAWTETNPNVYMEQIQARELPGRNDSVRIDVRVWKDDNIQGYVGPTKAGFNFAVDRYHKWRNAILEIIDALDKHLDVDEQLFTYDVSKREEEEEEA